MSYSSEITKNYLIKTSFLINKQNILIIYQKIHLFFISKLKTNKKNVIRK